ALSEYGWPGNVRELQNAIERAVVLGDSDTLRVEDLPESVLDFTPTAGSGSFQESLGDAKRDSILRAWVEAKGDYKAAGAALGIH
ncbi:hypothetical protein ACKI1O_51595, partial [Streptomyces scabiei]